MKGNQVAPAELEALLLEHPAVADAAVIGVPLYVNWRPLRKSKSVDQAKLADCFMRAHLAKMTNAQGHTSF